MEQMDLADPVEVIVTLQGYQAKLAGQVTSHAILPWTSVPCPV